jgi:hypothetical protein
MFYRLDHCKILLLQNTVQHRNELGALVLRMIEAPLELPTVAQAVVVTNRDNL